ncbi:MAG: YigZ family protein [Clostridia bacterium]|nr:YigZ family protein [Clostridia bacterium]
MAAKKNSVAIDNADNNTVKQTPSVITLSVTGESLYIDRRSEFIGLAVKIGSEEEVREIVAAVKKKHPDARHTVFAYRLCGGSIKRYSDDGEPQGSAGMPVLDVLEKNSIDGALITVTRYFGGILLGTGGLVRAYSSAASDALKNAKPVVLKPFSLIRASFEYSDWSKSETALKRAGAAARSTDFSSSVDVCLSVAEDKAQSVVDLITEITGGRCSPVITGTEMLPEEL